MADYYRADIKIQGPGISPSYLYNGKWKKSIITKRNRLLLHYLSDNPVLFSFLGLHPILHGPQLCLGP